MYQIQNKSNQYYLIFNFKRTYLGDEAAMLKYLIDSWHYSHFYKFEDKRLISVRTWNSLVFSNYSFEVKEYTYTIIDGNGKIVDISIYKNKTLDAAKHLMDKDEQSYYIENHNKYGIYRKTPVPYTKKNCRGGPSQKVRKTARLYRMYADPEQKEYNRGSSHGIPKWMDDFPWRKPQKSWKAQRKSRHQYKEKGD